MAAKVLKIDREIWQNARTYVDVQVETMRRFGSARKLSEREYRKLIRSCAEPVQRIKNWRKKHG